MYTTSFLLGLVLSSLAIASPVQQRQASATPVTSINPGGPIQACTTTITTRTPFGCTVTAAASTTTALIDCGGCDLAVETQEFHFGHGPVCVGGRKTNIVEGLVATATACST